MINSLAFKEFFMKKSIVTFVISSLFGSVTLANATTSRYDLVSKNHQECPLTIQVKVKNNAVTVSPSNSASMTPGPFSNTLFFAGFSNQWKVTEASSAGTFSVKSEYASDMTKSFVSEEEKFEKGGKTLRHTRVALTTTNATAYLSYDILALNSRMTAPAYTNILCQYTEAK